MKNYGASSLSFPLTSVLHRSSFDDYGGSPLFFIVCRKEKLDQEAKSSAERFEEVIMNLFFAVHI